MIAAVAQFRVTPLDLQYTAQVFIVPPLELDVKVMLRYRFTHWPPGTPWRATRLNPGRDLDADLRFDGLADLTWTEPHKLYYDERTVGLLRSQPHLDERAAAVLWPRFTDAP